MAVAVAPRLPNARDTAGASTSTAPAGRADASAGGKQKQPWLIRLGHRLCGFRS